jgi:hypothetical protein
MAENKHDPPDDSLFGIERSVSPFTSEALLAAARPLTSEAIVEAARMLANRFKPVITRKDVKNG